MLFTVFSQNIIILFSGKTKSPIIWPPDLGEEVNLVFGVIKIRRTFSEVNCL